MDTLTFEAAGIFFLPLCVGRNNMVGSGLSFLKTLIKSSLDNYVLPGTLTGTEILLLYASHWKRNFHAFVCGALHLISSEIDLLSANETPPEGEALSECAIECADPSDKP